MTNKLVLQLSAQIILQDQVHAGRRRVSFCGTVPGFYALIKKVTLYIVL